MIMKKNIYLLDATLRDGGQGLEDLHKNGFSDKIFSEEVKHSIIESLGNSNVDIIEIDFKEKRYVKKRYNCCNSYEQSRIK